MKEARDRSVIEQYATVIPDGMALSKKGEVYIEEARKAGVKNGTIYMAVTRAALETRQRGGNKVGPFGSAARHFELLKQAAFDSKYPHVAATKAALPAHAR